MSTVRAARVIRSWWAVPLVAALVAGLLAVVPGSGARSAETGSIQAVDVVASGVIAGSGYAVVEWDAPPGTEAFEITATIEGEESPVVVQQMTCGVHRSTTLLGLRPGIEHRVTVAALDAEGIASVGEPSGAITTPVPLTEQERAALALHTEGTTIRTAEGEGVRLRGFNIEWLDFVLDPADPRNEGAGRYLGHWPDWPDPAKGCSPVQDASVAAIAEWGANAVRIPVSSTFWQAEPAAADAACGRLPGYREAVDQVVASVVARGMLAVLDLHTHQRIACSPDTNWAHEMPDVTAVAFWRSMAERYGDQPLVAFELYNEPNGVEADTWYSGGKMESGDDGLHWVAAGMQQLYDAVRSTGAENLVIADGISLAQSPPVYTLRVWNPDPGYWWETPIAMLLRDSDGEPGRNVVYAAHHYEINDCVFVDHGGMYAWKHFSVTYDVPVVITEFGRKCDDQSVDFVASTIDFVQSPETCMSGWMAYRWSSNRDSTEHWHVYGMLDSPDQDLESFEPTPVGAVVKAALADPGPERLDRC